MVLPLQIHVAHGSRVCWIISGDVRDRGTALLREMHSNRWAFPRSSSVETSQPREDVPDRLPCTDTLTTRFTSRSDTRTSSET